MIKLEDKYIELMLTLKKEIPFEPEIALILGSGLGDFADSIEKVKSIPTNELPGYPASTVEGHKGYLHFAKYQDKKVLVFQGRIHFYEGYDISECLLPAFISKELNCRKLIITNAAGGVNKYYTPGDLMLIDSFNSINIKSQLSRLFNNDSQFYSVNFDNFPSREVNQKIRDAALKENINLKEGVYWFNTGPTYETPAEVKMAGLMGSDAVGMSTVHEAIYAAANGIEVGSISCITNMAAGISLTKLHHGEVVEIAEKVKPKFERLIKRIIIDL